MSVSRGDNESAPNLYIEFEDDEVAAVAGDAELVSGHEAIGSGTGGWAPRWQQGWRWGAVPTRYRKLVAGVAVLVGLGAAIGDSLAAQAAQRAADRTSVSVMDAAYSPSADGDGLDLLIAVTDTGQGSVTVTQAQVKQPDLSLDYLGVPLDLVAHQQQEIVLWGQYDCSLSDAAGSSSSAGAQAASVQLTVRSSQGNVNTLDLPLPTSAQLPDPWRAGRTAYCTWAWGAEN